MNTVKEPEGCWKEGAELEVFFDGACPLCRREILWIQRRNHAGKLRFTDIADPAEAMRRTGRSHEQLMSEIYGLTADGRLIHGVATLQRMYELVGFRRLVSISRLFGIRDLVRVSYRFWAKNRLRLTGRCTADVCAINGPSDPK